MWKTIRGRRPWVLLLLVGVSLLERADVASFLPSAVVLITFDAARRDVFPHACGGTMPDDLMPGLARFCQTATVFTHAVAPGPGTWLGIPSLYTGLDPVHHQVRVPPLLSPGVVTLAEVFTSRGYHTAVISGNPGQFAPETLVPQGFRIVDLRIPSNLRIRRPARTFSPKAPLWDPETLATVAAVRIRTLCPFCFIHVHFAQPHDPYGAPPEIVHAVAKRLGVRLDDRILRMQRGIMTVPLVRKLRGRRIPYDRLSPDQYATIRTLYISGLVWADRAFRRLLSAVQDRTDWARTIVVVAADHGESLGEHGFWGHGETVYEPEVRIPFVLKAPFVPPGRREEWVSLVDVFCTLVRAIRAPDWIRPPGSVCIDARPMRRRWVISDAYHMQALYFEQYKLVYRRSSQEAQLFDIAADPSESHDILPYHYRLGKTMFATLIAYRRLRMRPELPVGTLTWSADADWLEALRALGYTQVRRRMRVPRFRMVPQRLDPDSVRFRWVWIPRERDGVLRIHNMGPAAWPGRADPQTAGGVTITCEVRNGPRWQLWRYVLREDLPPGGVVVQTLPNVQAVRNCRWSQHDGT